MTTYTVITATSLDKDLYHGTSFNKAKKICDACEKPCYVVHFEKFNAPMPVDYWNDGFKAYVESRGNECFVGMKHF